MPKFKQIVTKEKELVSMDPDFKVVKDQAMEMKKQKNQTLEPLNLEKFKKQNDEWKEKTKSFEAIVKKPTGLKIEPPLADLNEINADTVSQTKSKNWISDLSKDLYLKQAVQTIRLTYNIK
jgi:carboxyl-terminal processing protease